MSKPWRKRRIALNAKFAAVAEPDKLSALKDTGTAQNFLQARVRTLSSRPPPGRPIGSSASISGAAGLAPTMAAVERGRSIAIANKECLVCAGGTVHARAAARNTTILPVDSEHNALFQAMGAGARSDVRRLILTASGGPFRTGLAEAINAASPEQALKHPNWSMGAKVTIDSRHADEQGPGID